MTMWSSEEFRAAWRYASASDLHSVQDALLVPSPIVLALGSETRSIDLHRSPVQSWFSSATISDGYWIAIPVGTEIDVYNTQTGERKVLSGQTQNVESVAFAPGSAGILVSSATGRSSSTPSEPEIIIWDVHTAPAEGRQLDVQAISRDAMTSIHSGLDKHGGPKLDAKENQELETTLSGMLKRTETYHRIPSSSRLVGRLCSSWASEVFNHAGDTMVYLPGATPRTRFSGYSQRSEGDGDDWFIALRWYRSTPPREISLVGHKAAMMWIGWSPDDRLVGSASWDGTFKVWDAETGAARWTFTTGKQNWAGCFSPDSKRLAGTDGDGVIRIWELETGQEMARYPAAEETPRPGSHMPREWRRTMAWSLDGRWLAVGSQNYGGILLFDVHDMHDNSLSRGSKSKTLVLHQERRLSMDRTDLSPERKRMSAQMLEIHSLRFLPGQDLKLAHTTTNDPGLEVVDLITGQLWRIAPEGQLTRASGAAASVADGPISRFQVDWTYLPQTQEIGYISGDKIRFWQLFK